MIVMKKMFCVVLNEIEYIYSQNLSLIIKVVKNMLERTFRTCQTILDSTTTYLY